MKKLLLLCFVLVATIALAQNPTVVDLSVTRHGPQSGTLLVIGGGAMTPELWNAFVERAGGKDARIVVITNASEAGDTSWQRTLDTLSARIGAKRVSRMHLTTIDEANDDKLIEPLKKATGIYFTGGRQWRIAEVYLDTKAHREMFRLLERGGVIAGSSAGASIQGSFLWRGDTRGPNILIGDHTQGLGFMKLTVIDQHILTRNRQHDLADFVAAASEFIGFGLDESTAIEVQGDELTVLGKSYVAVHCKELEQFIFLRKGQRFDLKTHQVIRRTNP
jgi:cyanophycinase